VREEFGIPVIMLTARVGIDDKMLAFRNGAAIIWSSRSIQ
jgi:DNA-binding response OmpR family regulator